MLPIDIWSVAFAYLDPSSATRAAMVSSLWNQAIESDAFAIEYWRMRISDVVGAQKSVCELLRESCAVCGTLNAAMIRNYPTGRIICLSCTSEYWSAVPKSVEGNTVWTGGGWRSPFTEKSKKHDIIIHDRGQQRRVEDCADDRTVKGSVEHVTDLPHGRQSDSGCVNDETQLAQGVKAPHESQR